jgi:hypothetical protein
MSDEMCYNLDATINLCVLIVEEKGILRIILHLTNTLRLPPDVVEIPRLKVVIVLSQVVWYIATNWGLDHGRL